MPVAPPMIGDIGKVDVVKDDNDGNDHGHATNDDSNADDRITETAFSLSSISSSPPLQKTTSAAATANTSTRKFSYFRSSSSNPQQREEASYLRPGSRSVAAANTISSRLPFHIELTC